MLSWWPCGLVLWQVIFAESEQIDQEKLCYFTGQTKAGTDLFKSPDSALSSSIQQPLTPCSYRELEMWLVQTTKYTLEFKDLVQR